MAYAMTKQGSLDNCVTYEFICDTVADMNAIEDRYRTIGSTAVVLQGDAGLEVYISGSDKIWTSLSVINGGSVPSGGGLSFHICGQDELDANGLPNVSEPDEVTFYLVPAADETTGNIYDEYIYVDDGWEKFGSGAPNIDLSAYALKANPAFTGSVSLDRYTGSTVGELSVSLGRQTQATGDYSFAEGNYTIASGSGAHAEGQSTVASAHNAHAEGLQTKARGNYSHAEGKWDTGSQTITYNNTTYYYGASGVASHSEGINTIAHDDGSHAEGNGTIAIGANSHAEGLGTKTTAVNSHAEGRETLASGIMSHAEGYGATASGYYAHAEGNDTIASGQTSHTEGQDSLASGSSAHAEGGATQATGTASHAEGAQTQATANYSHAEGGGSIASGHASHAEGMQTIAAGKYEHASGAYNVADTAPAWVASTLYQVGDLVLYNEKIYECKTANSDSTFSTSKWSTSGQYLVVVGNGTSSNARSNAYALDWDGNEYLKGDLYVRCNANSTGGTKVLTTSDLPDTSSLAPKASPVFTGSISLGRKANTTVGSNSVAVGENATASGSASFAEGSGATASGTQSHAEGGGTIASGVQSHAEGAGTQASGVQSHAEGVMTTASGQQSHAEGTNTKAFGNMSHTEGLNTQAFGTQGHAEGLGTKTFGDMSHAEGSFTQAIGACEHVSGQYNIIDSAPVWVASTSYNVGDLVSKDVTYTDSANQQTTYTCIYKCRTANSDSTFTSSKWIKSGIYAEIIGNGTADNARSNARTLDWEGNERLMGDLYVGCNADSTGGTKVAKISDIPDVQVNGTSVVSNGAANIPIAGNQQLGVVWVAGDGLGIRASGQLYAVPANETVIKEGTANYNQIVPSRQHQSVFYGLSKVAGVDLANETVTLGTYPAAAKAAIQSMLGVPGDVQVNGVSVVSNGVANIPIASVGGFGVTSLESNGGLETSTAGALRIAPGVLADVKAGADYRKPIVPVHQHEAVFYGLAKVAGQDMASSANAVGTYTAEAKAAIKSMIGVNVDDVQMNSTSIVSNGVATIPIIDGNGNYGVSKIASWAGIKAEPGGTLNIRAAGPVYIKSGVNTNYPIACNNLADVTYYGLAKAAGADMAEATGETVGIYPVNVKSAISDMLNAPETISGTAVSITAKSGIRYECGEVTTLTITLPATGDCEFIFESGSTPTVLTITPPTGVTAVKWPEWFDPEDLEADTTYDIIITNGRYGVVTSWA